MPGNFRDCGVLSFYDALGEKVQSMAGIGDAHISRVFCKLVMKAFQYEWQGMLNARAWMMIGRA